MRGAAFLRRAGVLAALAALLAGAPAAGRGAADAPRRQAVIIDTDIGDDIDDAFALAVAATDPRLEVLGVTTAWGDTRLRARLARRLLDAAGRRDVPVAAGEPTSETTPFTQARWAAREGDLAPAPDAVDFIADQARRRPGEITLVELSPMSNLQALMRRHPEALGRLRQVAFMGGSVRRGYDKGGAVPSAQPDAEYNVAQLPAAAAALLAAGGAVTMFPLDSTQLKFDEVRRERLFAYGSPLSDALTLLYHQWRLGNAWGQLTPTLFDAVPVLWLIDPAACPVTPLRIVVDARGDTREAAGAPNVRACLALDEDRAQHLLMQHLAPAP